MAQITALLPAYNEEVSIGSVVLRTRQFADRVIVVDDGSSDRTAEVAALAGAEVLRHAENQGKGTALKTGFAALNGDVVIVTIDTDGQQDASLDLNPWFTIIHQRGTETQRTEPRWEFAENEDEVSLRLCVSVVRFLNQSHSYRLFQTTQERQEKRWHSHAQQYYYSQVSN